MNSPHEPTTPPPGGSNASAAVSGDNDPVRRRRAQVARWTLLANRVGYLVLAVAVTLFVMAFVFGFTATMATLIVIFLVVSFALLAPTIVLGYAVKAAEREDLERGM